MVNDNMMLCSVDYELTTNNQEMKELAELMAQSEDMLKNFKFENGQHRLIVKVVNRSSNPLPTYAKYGDSGFDLRANLPDGPITIPAGKVVVVGTGQYFQVPYGWEMQVRSRTGLAAKHGMMVLNSPGTVDAGYRGEVMAIMFNTGAFGDFVVNHGDRICQGVIQTVVNDTYFQEVTELDPSERGTGKFGSTGIQ